MIKLIKKERVIYFLFILFIVYIFSGCSKSDVGNTNTINKENINKISKESTNEQDETGKLIPELITDKKSDKVIKKDGEAIFNDMAIIVGDSTLKIRDEVDEDLIEKLLGKPKDVEVHTYAFGDGLNMDMLEDYTYKEYTYDGLVIRILSNGPGADTFFLESIELTLSNYSTTRDIKVGDTSKMLEKKYPEAEFLDEDYTYRPADLSQIIDFDVRDGKITRIYIYYMVD